MKDLKRTVLPYTILGFLIGLIFPIAATVVTLFDRNLEPSFKAVLAVHVSEPHMLLFDTLPFILAGCFFLVGFQVSRYQRVSLNLSQHISDAKDKMAYEHLFLEALVNSSSYAIVRLDPDHHIITCNQQFEELFGYDNDEIVGKHLDDMIATDELKAEASRISESVSHGNLERLTSKRRRKDGSLVDVEIMGIPVSVGGEKIGILGLYNDISSQLAAQQFIKESESRFKSLFEDSPISLWEEDFSQVKQILDELGDPLDVITLLENDSSLVLKCLQAVKVIDINQATLDLYNANSKNDFLSGLSDILVDDSMSEFKNELIALVEGTTSYECEILQKKISGEIIHGWLRLSLPEEYRDNWERIYISIVDITDRRRAEEKMRFLSFHDKLTGLYNRAYFEEELRRLESGRQYPISFIACDLDGLKQINDNFGHSQGDCAIKAAAKILGSGTFRKEDVVARTGGDEFMIILPAVDINDYPTILQRIKEGIAKHNTSKCDDGLYRPISISYGYAVAHQGESLEQAINQADRAMYLQKTNKKSTQPR